MDQTRWRATRSYLREHRPQLTAQVARLYPDQPRAGHPLLLTRPGWLADRPIPLDAVRLQWTERASPNVDNLIAASRQLLPQRYDGEPFDTYAAAVEALDRPRLLADRFSYRLTGAEVAGPDPVLRFGAGSYFDVLNIGEAAAHEYAEYRVRGTDPGLEELPLRSLVGDPTDPLRRPVLNAVATLTVRLDAARGDARFLVHWRDPAKVATNGGYFQVTPVGMFQPAGDPGLRQREDFDLWRCLAREYSEELLGETEHENVDYGQWPFFGALEDARRAGRCRPYLLGIGIDPLTYAADIMTVVVFDAVSFDKLFNGMVEENDEGRTDVVGSPFTEETVREFADGDRMQPAGAAILNLAWQHRNTILNRAPRR
jgi:hypothetical protein